MLLPRFARFSLGFSTPEGWVVFLKDLTARQKAMTVKNDVYQQVTNQIIEAIEAGTSKFQLPWHRLNVGVPVNVASGKHYNGINVVALWAQEMHKGYDASLWGTYKQWAEKGAQVKKGEKATRIVFYKSLEVEHEESGEAKEIPMARMSLVFNVSQVEGYAQELPNTEPVNDLTEVNHFIAATGADIEHLGQTACYIPSQDKILMPEKHLFKGTDNKNATDSYYATLLHELTHWTGAKQRCNRALETNRDKESYAFEELIAELGAAFLCGELGIACEGRDDHAAYIAIWLEAMKGDSKLIFKAATQARKAVDFLKTLQDNQNGEAA